jgi:hypothetical protein
MNENKNKIKDMSINEIITNMTKSIFILCDCVSHNKLTYKILNEIFIYILIFIFIFLCINEIIKFVCI